MLSFRSRYQILTMARENVGKSRFLFRRVHKDDESTRKHQEKLNTGPKIKASLIRRSATDNCFTCCRLWSEILISYVRAANICLITSDLNWRRKASDGLRFLWKVLDIMWPLDISNKFKENLVIYYWKWKYQVFRIFFSPDH